VLGLAIVALALLLQTGPSRRYIASEISTRASAVLGMPLRIEGVTGVVPLDMRIATITIDDQDGTWLEVQDAHLKWSATALLGRVLHVEALTAETIRVARSPIFPESDSPTVWGIADLPALPQGVRVDSVAFNRVDIAATEARPAMALRATATYDAQAASPIHFELTGLDDTRLAATLSGGWTHDDITMTLKVEEQSLSAAYLPELGTVTLNAALRGPMHSAALTGHATAGGNELLSLSGTLAPLAPLTLALEGTLNLPDGLLPDSATQYLKGAIALGLDATLADTGQAQIKRLEISDQASALTLDGNVDLNSMQVDLAFEGKTDDLFLFAPEQQTEKPAPLLLHGKVAGKAGDIALDLRAEVSGHEWLAAQADLGTGATLSARGALKVLPASETLPETLDALLGDGAAADFDLALTDGVLHVTKADARTDSAALSAVGTVDWAASKADLTFNTKLDDLSDLAGLVGTALTGSAEAALRLESDGGQSSLHIEATGRAINAESIAVPQAELNADISGGTLEKLLSEPLAIALSGNFPGLELQSGQPRDLKLETTLTAHDFKRLDIAQFDVNDGNLVATASGSVNITSRQGDLTAAIQIADLAAYAAPFGYPYGGKLQMDAGVSSAEKDGTLVLTLKGKAEKLTGLPEAAGPLGDAASFDAHGEYDGEAIRMDTLTAVLGGTTVSSDLAFGFQGRSLNAKLDVAAKDLSPFAPLLGRPLAGSATVSAEISGTLDALAVRGGGEATSLRVDTLRAGTAQVEFDLKGIPEKTQGTFRVALDTKGDTLEASAVIAHTGNTIEITEFNADAGANMITAQGAWNLEMSTGAGTLNADLQNLHALRTWLDLPLKGALNVDARLAENATALTGTFAAKGLALPGLTIENAQAEMDIQHPFETPSGKISLTAATLKTGEMVFSTLTLSAEGPADAVQFALACNGDFQSTTDFSLNASGRANSSSWQVELQTLTAMLDTEEIALDAPTSLAVADGHLDLAPATLRLGTGQIEIAGAFAPERVDASATWREIPLSLAQMFDGIPYEGATSGSVTLSGTLAAPKGIMEIAITKFAYPGDESEENPSLDATISGTLEDGNAEATLTMSLAGTLQADGTVRVPVAWKLSPWEFTLAPQAPLSGDFTAKGDVTRLPEVLGLEGQVLRGNLAAQFNLRGTVAAPVLVGDGALSEGYYENAASGTILDTLSARFEAKGEKLRLAHFSATDSVGGKIQASGELSTGTTRPFFIDAELETMRLVNRDDMSAVVAGNLSFAGDDASAKVSGDLVVGPVLVVLPDRLPAQQVATVQFRVAGEDRPEDDAEATPPPADYPIALDISCAIPGDTVVRAHGLKSEWKGDLKIAGTAQAPRIKGVLQVRNGKLSFLGREFDLRESTITFSGNSPPVPMLNILAVSEQRGVTARVRLEGEMEDLNVTLESDPPASRDDVLSQVLFGRKATEISPLQGLQLAHYAAILSGSVSGMGILGSGGGPGGMLDTISIDSDGGMSDATLRAGKNLSDDLYLEVEQGVGTKGSAFSLEWLFAPNWSLRGKTGSNSEGGAGVFWKKDY